jgi:ligand-binding sensor domain-containing protein
LLYRTLLILLFITICDAFSAVAQQPYYYAINDENGLPSNEVYDIAQDEFGYMWIGCDAGLFRYDGFDFKRYSNVNQNAVAISNLHPGNDQRLFCQNFFGQIFYAYRDSLVLFADVKERTNAHPEYTIDDSNNMWVGLPDGIIKYNADGSKEYLFKGKLSVSELEYAGNGQLYAYDNASGLHIITQKEHQKYTIKPVADNEHYFLNSRITIKRYGKRFFALTTHNNKNNHAIVELKGDNIHLIRKIESDSIARFIYTVVLINNEFWLCTSDGAYRLSKDGKIDGHFFPGEKISTIYKDRENTYWFSTLQNGLYAIPLMELMLLKTENSTLRDNNITALKGLANDEILAGTYTGDIYRFHPSAGTLKLLPRDKKALYRNVTSIIAYDSQTVIAGRGEISIINTKAATETRYPSIYVRDMTIKGDSIIYVSTNGISTISNLARVVTNQSVTKSLINGTSGKKVCYETESKTLWVTINEGLAIMRENKFDLFYIGGKPVFCNALYTDKSGLWAGTVSDGLYNIRDKKVTLHLDKKNGLAGNNIKCITSQNDTLYVATDECINIRYPDGTFAYIKPSSGINAKEINAISISNPYIYVGTIRGLYYLPLNTGFKNYIKPNIRITSVFTGDIPRNSLREVQLDYDNKDILINFSSTAFRSRGRFYYLYRISGFQEEWKKQAGSINNVRLNHLPAGKFTFEVKAVNEDGIESETTAKLMLSVKSPFWQNWWFYLLVAMVASTFVALMFLLRIKTIKRKADIREQITNSQLTALKAQMNPHFMYNTLNSIQDLILQNNLKGTNYYLSRYSSLMRKILETSENKEIELAEETEILELYLELEQLRFGSDFQYSITISPEIDRTLVHIPSMIIQPFVENALKHGLLHKRGKKQLSIKFDTRETYLVCTINDNGVGRKKSEEIKQRSPLQHKSFATAATEKRLILINMNRQNKIRLTIKDLYEGEMATGTEVCLEIPLA